MKTYWLAPTSVGALFILAMASQTSGLPEWYRLRSDLNASRQRVEALLRETQELRAQIEALENDPFAVEQAIREELDLARPGETIVRFGGRAEPTYR